MILSLKLREAFYVFLGFKLKYASVLSTHFVLKSAMTAINGDCLLNTFQTRETPVQTTYFVWLDYSHFYTSKGLGPSGFEGGNGVAK